MGNFFSFLASEEKGTDFSTFDELTKDRLIQLLKDLKTKKLNPEDGPINELDLECTNIIPLCIEAYKKLEKMLKEDKLSAHPKLKKTYFIKPTFSIDKIKIDAPSSSPQEAQLNYAVKAPVVLFNDNAITIEEFRNAFNNGNNSKDMIGISKKILSMMPSFIQQRFIVAFNKIYQNKSSINEISFGKGSYIYKLGKNGPKDSEDSFRKIIAIPNVVNHFHRTLALRINEFLSKNNYIDTTIQKGGIAGQKFGILQQIFKLKCVLRKANLDKAKAAVMFLDISNAFGNVDLNNLQKILEKYMIGDNFRDYLRRYYECFEFYMQTNQWTTQSYKWPKGLIQGCPMSPILFVLVINYILTEINNECAAHGFDISLNVKILFLAFVDDICITCKDQKSLEIVFEKLERKLKEFGLPLNIDKCGIFLINHGDEDKIKEDSILSTIPVISDYKYLGEYVSSNGDVTQSFKKFCSLVWSRLNKLDKTIKDEQTKIDLFEKSIMPFISKKLTAMFDLNKTQKLKFVTLIKEFTDKWNYKKEIGLFCNIKELMNVVDDDVIKNMDMTNFDVNIKEELELTNYIMNNNVKFSYEDICEDLEIEDLDFVEDD